MHSLAPFPLYDCSMHRSVSSAPSLAAHFFERRVQLRVPLLRSEHGAEPVNEKRRSSQLESLSGMSAHCADSRLARRCFVSLAVAFASSG